MSVKMISIIIPVYNTERFIEDCIKSILLQTYSFFELILVDDGSTDNSLHICKKYEKVDKRIKVFSKQNNGVSSTRNFGLARASGDWIMFVDSDDTINPDTLQSLVEKVVCDDMIVCCGAKYDNGDDYFVFKNLSIEDVDPDDLGHVLLYGPPWGKLYNRNIIESNNLRFDESISKSEDTLFFWQYMNCVSNVATTSYMGYNYFRPQKKMHQSLANRLTNPFVLLKTESMLSMEYAKLQHRFQVSNDRNYLVLKWFESILIEALYSCYWLQLSCNERHNVWRKVNAVIDENCSYSIVRRFRKYPYLFVDLYYISLSKIKNVLKKWKIDQLINLI